MATLNNANKLNTAIFKRRILTLKKKAMELGILCDVPVTLVCYGTKGELYTWPEDKEECKNAVMQFKQIARREKKVVGTFLKSKSKKLGGGPAKTSDITMEKSIEIVDERIELSIDKKELLGVECYLEKKLKDLQEIKFALQIKNELKKNEKDQPMTSAKTLTQDQTKMNYGVYNCKRITGSDQNILSNYNNGCTSYSSEEERMLLTTDSCNAPVVGIPVGSIGYGYGFNNFDQMAFDFNQMYGFNNQNTMDWGINSNCNYTNAGYGSELDYGTNSMCCSSLIGQHLTMSDDNWSSSISSNDLGFNYDYQL